MKNKIEYVDDCKKYQTCKIHVGGKCVKNCEFYVKKITKKTNLEEKLNQIFIQQKKLINENYDLKTLIILLIKELRDNKVSRDIINKYNLEYESIQEKYYDKDN